jgi:Uri superfamily endonuclease
VSPRGTYALLLHLSAPQNVAVGALGALSFPSGWYVYLGSARGPGGLPARLARHRRRGDKRHHWHIDYLRAVTTLVEVWTSTCETQHECDWATAAAAMSSASIIAPRFGASDCQCASHFFHFSLRPEPGEFVALVQTELVRERLGEQTGCVGQGA